MKGNLLLALLIIEKQTEKVSKDGSKTSFQSHLDSDLKEGWIYRELGGRGPSGTDNSVYCVKFTSRGATAGRRW